MVAGLVAAGGIAATASAQHQADVDLGGVPIEFEFSEDLSQLVYWLPSEEPLAEGEEPLDCVSLLTPLEDGEAATDTEIPDGCYLIDVAGPNGQVNHGSIVSATVQSIKYLEYDGPRGQLVSEIAKSGLGSGNDAVADDGDDDDSGDAAESDEIKPEKEKKEKKEDHPGRGNSKP